MLISFHTWATYSKAGLRLGQFVGLSCLKVFTWLLAVWNIVPLFGELWAELASYFIRMIFKWHYLQNIARPPRLIELLPLL